MRNHYCRAPLEKLSVKDQMDPLAGLDRAGGVRLIHEPDLIGENACRIDHDPSAEPIGRTCFFIPAADSANHSVRLGDPGDRHVVESAGAVVHRGLRERDRETRVVKLAIEILYSSEEVFRLDIRDSGKRFLAGEDFGRSEVQAAGQCVVDLQPDSEKWSLPPFVARNNKGEVMDKMGRVPMEQAPFPQCFQDQRNIALLKVTNAAVNQFCAAA